MARKSFRSKVLELRPDVAESKAGSEFKRKLALTLRALRKSRKLTQVDVEKRSGLSQPMISRLEAPTGPLPTWDTVMRYAQACGSHMLVGFSPEELDESKLNLVKEDSETVLFAVAV